MKIKWIIVTIAILALIFIGSNVGRKTVNPFEQKKAYWKSVVASELPIGTTKRAVVEWCKGRKLLEGVFKEDDFRVVADGFWRENFYIVMHFDPQGRLDKRDLEITENCQFSFTHLE